MNEDRVREGDRAQAHDSFMKIGWRRPIGCLICRRYCPQKSPMISGSLAKRDLELMASYAFSPLCMTYWSSSEGENHSWLIDLHLKESSSTRVMNHSSKERHCSTLQHEWFTNESLLWKTHLLWETSLFTSDSRITRHLKERITRLRRDTAARCSKLQHRTGTWLLHDMPGKMSDSLL